MSEVKKIATRASYGSALVELGKEHDDLVVLDADLAAATQTGMFKKEFPDRHIDCGIAECNMVGIGAGLATTGKGLLLLSAHLQCSQQDVLTNSFATLLHIRI